MKVNTIAVVAGGTFSSQFFPEVREANVIIAADRGAWRLIEEGIIPQFAIGDFDSVNDEQMEIIQEMSPNVVQYSKEKEETDLELAVQLALSFHPKQIVVYGGTGTRLDQTLAGIFLLEGFNEVDIAYKDEHNEICLITKEKTFTSSTLFPYCSLLPITSSAVVTLTGFKYPLLNGRLQRSKTLGISNELIKNKGRVTVHSGKVLFIRSKD